MIHDSDFANRRKKYIIWIDRKKEGKLKSMINLRKLQREIYKNKVEKKFNVKDVNLEFCLIYEELTEAQKAYRKKLPDLGEELADVTIYLLGLAEILGIDLEREIIKKVSNNQKREYKWVDGKLARTKED